jgi:hypothetical protein
MTYLMVLASYIIFIHSMDFDPLCLSRGLLHVLTLLHAHKCYICFYILPHLFSSPHMETADGRSFTFSDTKLVFFFYILIQITYLWLV